MDSGYPTSEVVKTASPLIFALAPKLLPWWIGPSRMVNVARSKDGLVARLETDGGGERGVLSTSVALYLTWTAGLLRTFFAVKPAVGLQALNIFVKVVVAMTVVDA